MYPGTPAKITPTAEGEARTMFYGTRLALSEQ